MDKQLTYSLQVVIHACTPANINKVEDLALSSEDKPRKQFTIKKIAWHISIFLGSVSTVINW